MNSEIFDIYFTDIQIATIEGITLGGLRNKIYRQSKAKADKDVATPADLPEFIVVSPRNRLWRKEVVRAWLMERYRGDAQTVDRLMKAGEACPPTAEGEKDGSAAKAKKATKAE